MGRPRNDPPSIQINVRLYLQPGVDDDLIAFFRKYPTGCGLRPSMVKAALRGGALETMEGIEGEFLDDMLDAFDDRTW